MAVKLTDNMKFLLGFVVYIAYASWWASGVSTNVSANTATSKETLLVLRDHMKECGEMHEHVAAIDEKVKNNSKSIEILHNIIFIPQHRD